MVFNANFTPHKYNVYVYDNRLGIFSSYPDYFLKPNSDFEIVHMKACRHILGVNKTTCVHACLGELTRLPLLFCFIINVIKYWVHLESIPNDSLAVAFKLANKLHAKCLFTFFGICLLTP